MADPAHQSPADAMRQLRDEIAAEPETRTPAAAPPGDLVAESLERAAQRADIGIALPPLEHLGRLRRAFATLTGRVVLYFLRLITTDQRQVNHLVLRALRELDRRQRVLHSEATGLVSQLAAAQRELAAGQRERDELRVEQARLTAFSEALTRLHVGERLTALEAAIGERDRWLAHASDRQDALEAGVGERLTALEAAIGERDRWLARASDRQDALEAGVGERDSRLGERLTALEAAIGERDRWLERASDRLDAFEAGVGERDRWFADLRSREDRIQQALADVRETGAYLRGQIADRDRRIDALLSEVGAHRAAAPATAAAISSGDGPPQAHEPLSQIEAKATVPMLPDEVLDAWAFVEAFRGEEATVRELQRGYVRFFVAHGPVLDVGCGRGEFLELLRDAGVAARGIDLSNEMVLRCREKELDVAKADAISHLAALPDESLGGIFCAQVVEHMPTAAVLALIRLAYAKLRADGVLIVETLNPESLIVHYRWFPMDPTHVRLVHPETLKFLLVSSGFRDLEGQFTPDREASPDLPPLALPGAEPEGLERFNAATAHVNRLLHGDPDYAIIARR